MEGIAQYVKLAKDTGVFKEIELDILEGVLSTWEKDAAKGYTVVELGYSGNLAGFAVFSTVPLTDFSYELHWFVADRAYQRAGVGHQLMELVEAEALKNHRDAILRIETSARKELSYQQRFFETCGFTLIGRIADFYEAGDDFLMYAKFVSKAAPDTEAPAKTV